LDATADRCRWIQVKSWHQWGDNHCVRCMPQDVTPVGMDLLFIKANRYILFIYSIMSTLLVCTLCTYLMIDLVGNSDIDPQRLSFETEMELNWFNNAPQYQSVSYVTPGSNVTLASTGLTILDINDRPVAWAQPNGDFSNRISQCLARTRGDGVTACDAMPAEPPVLLEWMAKNPRKQPIT
jgi:hypothetical protein